MKKHKRFSWFALSIEINTKNQFNNSINCYLFYKNMENMFKIEQLWQIKQADRMKRGLINKWHVRFVGDKIQTFRIK